MELDDIKKYLYEIENVSMAFVFGSVAKKTNGSESDIDIGIYFTPSSEQTEWETLKEYPNEDRIWSNLERLSGRKVDLVVLNRAPSVLAFTIITEGEKLFIKEYNVYLKFMLAISDAADDFMFFTQDYWKIKQRSSSLSDIDKERLIRIIDFFEDELRDIDCFVGITDKQYRENKEIKRNVERWVENLVNSAIDISKILLASNYKPIPRTYRNILDDLSLLDGFDEAQANAIAQFSKLRNILAHEYLDIRFKYIKFFIENAYEPLSFLLEYTKKNIKS